VAQATRGWIPVGRAVAGARRRAATTPGRLRVLSLLVAASATALAGIGAGALIVAEVTVTGIQDRTVPSIMGMQRIHAWLAEADRSAANAYLAGGSEVTLSEFQYQADIAAASRELQRASEHNPGGGDTSQRLQAIVTAVDQYESLIQTASVDDRLGLPVGTVYLSAGTSLMHRPGTGILAQVDALRGIYQDGLDRANRTLRLMTLLVAAYAVVATLVLALLLRTQRFLRRRFRRRHNRRLQAATLLLLLVSAASGFGAVEASRSIRAAEDQSYARLLNLWNARALVYDANGDESLSLIARDAANRATADEAFANATRALVDRPLTDELVEGARAGRVGFNGLLADELRAAGSPAERSAAMRVLELYRTFLAVDAQVRAHQLRGDIQAAAQLTLGTDKGQLTFAFADVDWYLGEVIDMLQAEFDRTMDTAELVIVATTGAELLTLLIAALTFWGVQPRIDEYL
jgi:hypothetical protein